MDNIFINAGFVTVIFTLIKFAEMRFIEKDAQRKPVKLIIRDSLIVYISIIVAHFVIDQITPIVNSDCVSNHVFTQEPDF